MPTVHVVTDSNCHIPPALCQELGIHVVPLPFTWDGKTYLDMVDMGPQEFYSRLRKSQTLPKTSGPTPGSFIEVFDRLTHDGNAVLGILVGSQFSSTFTSSKVARNELPGRTIELIDSDSNGLALGFQVLAAARTIKAGRGMGDAIKAAEVARANSGLLFAVSDLNYLRRGGRIAFAENLIGNLLKVVPLMEISGGPIKIVERVRSSTRIIPRLIELTEKRLSFGRPYQIGVLHADAESTAWELMGRIREHIQPDELFISELNPILGVHAGPGAIGLGYCSGINNDD
ncbi:MAG: DegV family protein [Anaerolineales bacterium]